MAKASYKDRQGFKSIDPLIARDLLDYNPETGELFWRYREGAWPGFNGRFAGKVAGCRHICTIGKAYIQVRLLNELHYAHRLAWIIANGPIPDGMQIDHVNGDGTDNRLVNLRLTTPSENKRNMRRMRTNKTGVTGVVGPDRHGSYSALGWMDGKQIAMYRGKDFAAAVAARKAWEVERGYHKNHGQDRPL